MRIEIKKLRPAAELPAYQTGGSAAMDLAACLDAPVELAPMERRVIPTGLAVALPQGYELQIRARSGLSLKHGLCMANGVGTIDSDYRGEVGVIVINLGDQPFTIEPGMRIAQGVVARYETAAWQVVDELDATERAAGGFGSTGH